MSLALGGLYAMLPLLCAAAAATGLYGWWRGREALARAGAALGALAGAAVAVAWGWRWGQAGHLPLFGTYESSLSLALVVLACGGLVQTRSRIAAVVPATCLVAAGVLLHGMSFDPAIYALTISERSWVVDLHAILAWSAFGVLAVNAGLALVVLRRGGRHEPWLVRTLSWGFLLHTAMLASGSFYKLLLFGTLWSFDPVETLALVAWLAYGSLLHLCLMGSWRGRRLAAWCLGLFVLLVVSYRVIVYFPPWSTYHIFDMDRRIHVVGS